MTAQPYRPFLMSNSTYRYERINLAGSVTKERKPNIYEAEKSWATWFYEEVRTNRWFKHQRNMDFIRHKNLSEASIAAIIKEYGNV